MNKDAIRWHSFPRDKLPEVLLSTHNEPWLGRLSREPYDVAGESVGIGYAESRSREDYNPPCLLVINHKSAPETMSWLRVYAPETFPLSQYARVVSNEDWLKFNSVSAYRKSPREDIWASVVLGEVLAQSEPDAELSSIPLSRAGACFSISIARAACSYGSDEATRTCTERLRHLEADRRFVRRAVTIDDLTPIWAMASSDFGEAVGAEEAAVLVLRAAEKLIPDSRHTLFPTPISLSDLPALLSDSIEERVVTFHHLSKKLISAEQTSPRSMYSSVLLAAAAFLVGRGTTHEFLLRRVSKQFPAASAWYGLIAALAGPDTWDPNWARASKGIERQIRSRFDWSESTGFDLSWLEYSWMASTFEGQDAFIALPKLMPRVLSIEVIPGSTCQFRLMITGQGHDTDVRQESDTSRERDLQAALSQFIALANRTRALVESSNQQSLLTEDGESRYSKNRAKRGKNQSKA